MTQKLKNEIKVKLSIYGDTFDPKELTDLLQIQPTHTQIKGEKIPLEPGLKSIPDRPEPVYIETLWSYSTPYMRTCDSEDVSIIIEEVIRNKVSLIKSFVNQNNLGVVLSVIPYIDKRSTPSIHFSNTFLKMLSDLNADIDIDMYVV